MDKKMSRPRGRPPGKVPASKRINRPKKTDKRGKYKALKANGAVEQELAGPAQRPDLPEPRSPVQELLRVPEFNTLAVDSPKSKTQDIFQSVSQLLPEEKLSDSLHHGSVNLPDPAIEDQGTFLIQDKVTFLLVVKEEPGLGHEIETPPSGLNVKGSPIKKSVSPLVKPEPEVISSHSAPTPASPILDSLKPDPNVDCEVTHGDSSTLLPLAEVMAWGNMQKRVIELVLSLLPKGWTAQIYSELMYALQVTMPPYRVRRAICFFFNGEISVEVDGKTLQKTHCIFNDPLLECPGPEIIESLESFASRVRRAAYAIQSYKKCIGVDADNSVEEWMKHPVCRLDDEEGDAQKVLRTRECSVLVSRSKKRCTACSRYQEVLRKRVARKSVNPSATVHEHTAHNILPPHQLRNVIRAKQNIIKKQALQLRRMRERVAQMVDNQTLLDLQGNLGIKRHRGKTEP